MAQSGFMLYANDWLDWTSDYTDEETGKMLKALLIFFTTGETTEFDDRGMKQFFRQATKAIELDRKRYDDKCLKNAYNRYKGICQKNGKTPLEFEDWERANNEEQPSSTIVNHRQEQPPKTTSNNTNSNNSFSINPNDNNGNRSAEGEQVHVTITEALQQGRITEDEAVSLRLQGREYV